jgi:hypothetical protein
MSQSCWHGGSDGSAKITSTSEFDNKNTDKVIVFGSNEKGLAADIKDKCQLGSQRVLYVYLPKRDEIVRMIVKPSALSGDKNPDKDAEGKSIPRALGLFEYVDQLNADGAFLHENMTTFGSVYREDAKNKRKSYFAMTFSVGEKLGEEQAVKAVEMVKEVHEKTTTTNFADEYVPPAASGASGGIDYPAEDINPDDVPF